MCVDPNFVSLVPIDDVELDPFDCEELVVGLKW
jgi:hypothetical protein